MRVRCPGGLPCQSPKIHISARAQGTCHGNGQSSCVLHRHLVPPQQEPCRIPPQGMDLGSSQEGLARSPQGSATCEQVPEHLLFKLPI